MVLENSLKKKMTETSKIEFKKLTYQFKVLKESLWEKYKGNYTQTNQSHATKRRRENY